MSTFQKAANLALVCLVSIFCLDVSGLLPLLVKGESVTKHPVAMLIYLVGMVLLSIPYTVALARSNK